SSDLRPLSARASARRGSASRGPGIGLQWSTQPRRHPPTNTQPDDCSAGLVALMMAESIPSVAWWVAWMVMSTNPASSSRWRYSEYVSAPAMHPTQEPLSARSSGVREASAATSEIPMRPPGLRTLAISEITAGLSADRLMTQLEMTTSMVASSRGMSSMYPSMNSTLVTPASAALRRAASS